MSISADSKPFTAARTTQSKTETALNGPYQIELAELSRGYRTRDDN